MTTERKQNNRIPVIGITGGAGSGKSHIAGLLEKVCKVSHINTDRISQEQMMKGGCVYGEVLAYFGTEFLAADGEIDRKKLGEYVFCCPEELAVLNSLTHPPVREEVERRIRVAAEDGYELILLETALLIEAGYEDVCDEVWYVYAGRATRRKRLQETRGYSLERVNGMFRRQNTDKYFREHADYVIDNNARDDASIVRSIRRRLSKIKKSLH